MDRILLGLGAVLTVLWPYIQVVLLTFVGRYVLVHVGGVFERLSLGMQRLAEAGNKHRYLRIAEFDDWLCDRLTEVIEGTKDAVVDGLKAAHEDGKLTPVEAKKVLDAATAAFMEGLSKLEYAEVISILGKDFHNIVSARIPGIVAGAKAGNVEGGLYYDVRSESSE